MYLEAVFMDLTPDLTKDEMVEILKNIAREGTNAAARIAAIKELRAIQNDGKPVASAFSALDAGTGGAASRTGTRLKAEDGA